jgi:hypothetical protein
MQARRVGRGRPPHPHPGSKTLQVVGEAAGRLSQLGASPIVEVLPCPDLVLGGRPERLEIGEPAHRAGVLRRVRGNSIT